MAKRKTAKRNPPRPRQSPPAYWVEPERPIRPPRERCSDDLDPTDYASYLNDDAVGDELASRLFTLPRITTSIGGLRLKLWVALGMPQTEGGIIIDWKKSSSLSDLHRANEAECAERIARWGKAQGVDQTEPWRAADKLVPYLRNKGLTRDEIDYASLCELAALIDVPATFVPNAFQQSILDALDGRALKVQALAIEVCGGERSRLYKPGGIKELKAAGKVAHKPRLGYYRPDVPPAGTK